MAHREWFEDEDFWRIFGDCMFAEARFRDAEADVEPILALTGLAEGTVLDLGCGPGRHAIPLARRGFAVTAVDLSAGLLKRARARARRAGVATEFVCEDMRRFARPGGFDLIVSLATSFGFFDDPADDLRVLAQCHRNLRQGGALLLDLVGKEYLVRHLEPVHLTEFDDGALLIERPVLEAQMSRYANQWILIRDGIAHTAHWHQNLYSGVELADRLRSAGFSEVAIYGGLDGRDYDLESERLIALARK